MVDLDRLERALIAAARERRPVTYGRLLAYFERRVTRITVGALCRDLGRLESRREAEGWPELACLVVRKADGLPGGGYFASLRAGGAYDGPDTGPVAEALLHRRQAAAYAWAAGLEGTTERAGGARSGGPPQLADFAPAASRSR